MKFTRRQVLEAIRFENLTAGNFYNRYHDASGKNKCEVCAVGAVLQRAGVKPSKISDKAWKLVGGGGQCVDQAGDELEALKEKNYLAALSIKFEKLADELGTGKRTRKILSNFVKANFPKEFTNVKERLL